MAGADDAAVAAKQEAKQEAKEEASEITKTKVKGRTAFALSINSGERKHTFVQILHHAHGPIKLPHHKTLKDIETNPRLMNVQCY